MHPLSTATAEYPARRASIAQASPVGPAPMISTSNCSTVHDLTNECYNGLPSNVVNWDWFKAALDILAFYASQRLLLCKPIITQDDRLWCSDCGLHRELVSSRST